MEIAASFAPMATYHARRSKKLGPQAGRVPAVAEAGFSSSTSRDLSPSSEDISAVGVATVRIADHSVLTGDVREGKGCRAAYVSRVLRLTLLAPEIVEAILDGRQPAELQLDDLLKGFPLGWKGQRREFGFLNVCIRGSASLISRWRSVSGRPFCRSQSIQF